VSAKGQQSGSASRFEDEPHHGWSPDVGSEKKTAAEAGEKAMRKPPKETDEGGQVLQEGTGGISPTDTDPKSPFGVGESHTRRGEEIAVEEGKKAESRKGASQRPYGTTDPEEATGVAPQGPQHPDSPNMPPGDQGG
jgi:hypothetical protein